MLNKINGKVIIRILSRGEDIYKAIESVAIEHNIVAGIFNMIGAVSEAVIGYFDDSKKEYIKKTFKKDMEIVSCMGNITRKSDGSVVVHGHIALADENTNMYGGHLFPGTLAGATGEIFILPMEKTIVREQDKHTGLFLIAKQIDI